MEWAILFIAFDLLVLALLLGHSDSVPVEAAADHLRNGALLIDVRMPTEFAASHLPNAVNIPLTGISKLVPIRIKDKSRVLLLHGHIGMRSGIAKLMLVELGYSNAINLGSYHRAAQVASGQ
jgi:phage shock protein E